jgi:hypothetical protein
MTKKRSKKNKETPEQNDIEPVENNIPEVEPAMDETDAVVVDTNSSDEDEVQSLDVNESSDDVQLDTEDEISPDDLLDDVRRSLIEENARAEEEKKPNWWQKLGDGRRKTKDTEDIEPVADAYLEEDVDLDMAETESFEQDDAGDSIDDLIEMLETEDEVSAVEMETESTFVQLEEQSEIEKVDVDELKKRAFQGSTPEDNDVNFSDVRSVALEGGGDVFVEVEVKTEDPVEDRLKSLENALRPYRSYINFGIAFIGIVVIVATSALLYGAYKKSLPPEPVQEISNLPYPVVLNIPGGLSFNLGRGSLDNGRWNPQGPEWLEGTEVCRWVAIRYSRQLEAVVRTLTREDKLTLTMSNSDVVSYDVFSITQMTIEDMQQVSSNTPCLLLVLADANTDTRWVVTAYP